MALHSVRSLRALLALLAVFFLAGCIMIPIPEDEGTLTFGRGQIQETDLSFLEPGKSTREEVLLRFGEPSQVLNNEKLIVYRWAVDAGLLVVYPAPILDYSRFYVVLLEFDENGRLVRTKRSGSIWSGEQSIINEWNPEEGEKLSAGIPIIISPRPAPYVPMGVIDKPFRGTKIQVGDFVDLRVGQGARRVAVIKSFPHWLQPVDILTRQPVTGIMRDAVIDQLATMGAEITDRQPDAVISGEVRSFGIETSYSHFTKYEIVGSLETVLRVKPISGEETEGPSRTFRAIRTKKSLHYPDDALYSRILQGCLEGFLAKLGTDQEFLQLLKGGVTPDQKVNHD